ncbi:MAG: hypothetical protein KDK91_25265, partial [Gammaproteobacteria bacterium]|nr:hypothetical protein [Gammaproteobacteria bacterium]
MQSPDPAPAGTTSVDDGDLDARSLADLLRATLSLWQVDGEVRAGTTASGPVQMRCAGIRLEVRRDVDPSLDRPCWTLRHGPCETALGLGPDTGVEPGLPSIPVLLRRLRELLGLPAGAGRALIGRRPSVAGPTRSSAARTQPLQCAPDRHASLPVHVLTGFLGSGKTT